MNKINWERLLAISFVVLFWAVVIGALAGCARASDPRDGTNAPGDTSPAKERPFDREVFSDMGVGIVTDNETGCQYLTIYAKGMTPRMGRYEDGKQRQMGCIEQIHMTNLMEGLDK